MVLHVIMGDGIGGGDGVAVHGVERYADMAALSKHTVYDFKVKYHDTA